MSHSFSIQISNFNLHSSSFENIWGMVENLFLSKKGVKEGKTEFVCQVTTFTIPNKTTEVVLNTGMSFQEACDKVMSSLDD